MADEWIPDSTDAELTRMIRQEKAEAAIRAVQKGANPTIEAFLLANEFTDSVTARVRNRVRLLLRRRLS